jgi:hypothetical protein
MNQDEIILLINKISEMEGNNLLEKIIDYCETFDEDPQEIGDILSECESFKDILLRDCVKNHIITLNKDIKIDIPQEVEEW